MAAGAEIHAAAPSGELRVRGTAGRTGLADSAGGPATVVPGCGRLCHHLLPAMAGIGYSLCDHPRRAADAAVWLRDPGAGRGQSAGANAWDQAAGVCGRGQLLPLPAPLQLLEPGPRYPRAESAGPERA